jgi:polysaccharide chain length determinant protein (PEP-CTERM system associated)
MLEAVMKEHQLFPEAKTSVEVEGVIAKMRKDIKVETKGGGQMQLFTISFVYHNPEVAQRVATTLTNRFIQDQVRIREEFVHGATEFIDQQLESARRSLEQKEEKISAFKLRHMGELPGQLETNLRTLDRLQKELAAVNEALQKSTDRKLAIQKALNSYEAVKEPLEQELREQRTVIRPIAPAARVSTTVDPNIVRLNELERQLEVLSAAFKETYPDVVQTKLEIVRLKALIAIRNKEDKFDETPSPDSASVTQEVKGIREVKSFQRPTVDPFVQELTAQRHDAEVGIDSMMDRKKQLMVQIREYELRVEKTPLLEQEMSALLRDYQNMEKNYQSLLEKKLNAQVAEDLEKRRKGEQFRMLDSANLPQSPEKPEVLKIMLLGLLGGCGVGVATAVMLDNANPVFRRQSDAETLLGLPVLAGIPSFSTIYQSVGQSGRSFWGGNHLYDQRALVHDRESEKSVAKSTALAKMRQKPVYGQSYGATGGGQQGSVSPVLNLVSKWRPASLIAEQYRVAATRLVLMVSEQQGATVAVTSSVKGEGKSSTSVNLAYVLGHDLGKRTLLIDCDTKNPTVHRYLGMDQSVGLTDVLSAERPVEEALRQFEGTSLWVLTSGRRSSAELAAMGKLNALLPKLRGEFDYIILDSPPILPLADMNVIAGFVDALVMVIQAGITGTAVVQRALRNLLPTCKAGVIITNIQSTETPYYMKAHAEYTAVESGKKP